jgi:hypothetical protein
MQWYQDPNQSSVDNLNNVRHGASRPFGNKKRNILNLKLRKLKLTVRFKISETCTRESMTLREVTSLELI